MATETVSTDSQVVTVTHLRVCRNESELVKCISIVMSLPGSNFVVEELNRVTFSLPGRRETVVNVRHLSFHFKL